MHRTTSACGASVGVDGQALGEIDVGSLAFVGVERNNKIAQANRLLERVLNYRLFNDCAGKMNLSLRDIGGGLLLVPQFTLATQTNSGNRLSFAAAAPDR